MTTRQEEIIERFCALQTEVWQKVIDPLHAADCFCYRSAARDAKGWHYANGGQALEWIEQVVREALAKAEPFKRKESEDGDD